MSVPAELTVLAPGLLPAPPDPPRLPALERLIARAGEQLAAGGYYQALFRAFGAATGPAPALPIAAATRRHDAPEDHAGIWMRADPVFLRADLHKLLLFDAAAFDLDLEEARALAAELNAALAGRAPPLDVASAKRWYMRLEAHPGFAAAPPEDIAGEHLDPHLSRAAAARDWHRLGTEIQMLLHAADANRARVARGAPPVNGVWFWGAGAAPALGAGAFDRVLSDEPAALGLAALAGSACLALPARAEEFVDCLASGGRLLVVTRLDRGAAQAVDPNRWCERAAALEARIFAPALAALGEGRLARLRIATGARQFTLTRALLRRFWRRARRLPSGPGGSAARGG
jgi:hypothetical protein